MSTCISAITSHRWGGFSPQVIEQVSRAASLHPGPIRLVSESGSADLDFARFGAVTFHLPGNFILTLARKTLSLAHSERWGRFLIRHEVRQDLLAACQRVADLAGATEIMLLPEGTVIEDLLHGDTDFEGIKQRAADEWGPPDLDMCRLYTEQEIEAMSQDRVHYSLVDVGPQAQPAQPGIC